ncbi:unnamed protein product, partial [Laminaria digitata]
MGERRKLTRQEVVERLSRSVAQELSHLDNAVPVSPNRRSAWEAPVAPHELNGDESVGVSDGERGVSSSVPRANGRATGGAIATAPAEE